MTDELELRDRALNSFWVFCQEILEMNLADQPHQEMCAYFEDTLQPNRMMLVPRDCLKTTIGTAYCLWMVLRAFFLDGNPCYRVLVDSATTRLSDFVVNGIKSWVKNSIPLKETFGNLYTKAGDKKEGFSLTFRVNASTNIREPNFVSSGIGSEKTGLHFELMLLDDLVTEKNYRTVDLRQKTWDHYRLMHSIIESDPNGQKTKLLISGTRYHDDDLYGRIILQDKERIANGEAPAFAPMIRGAIDEDGNLFYPKKLTKEVLAKKRAAQEDFFWGQYMNDPNKAGAPLKKEQLKWHSIGSFPRELKWVRLSADPAYKEQQKTHGDYSALVVAGWDRWNALWILDVVMRKDLTPELFIEQCFFLAKKWQIECALIENPHQEAMDVLFRREMQARQASFPIFWVKPSRTRGKEMRWLDIQAYAERYAIKIAEEIPPATRVEIQDEWERAPFSRYDDFLDALQLQTLYLPVDLTSNDDAVVPLGGRSVEEILDAGRAGGTTPYYGTLADRFPIVAQIQNAQNDETSPFFLDEPQIASEMEAIFEEG